MVNNIKLFKITDGIWINVYNIALLDANEDYTIAMNDYTIYNVDKDIFDKVLDIALDLYMLFMIDSGKYVNFSLVSLAVEDNNGDFDISLVGGSEFKLEISKGFELLKYAGISM